MVGRTMKSLLTEEVSPKARGEGVSPQVHLLTSMMVTGEKHSAWEIEKPWPEWLDNKEFLEGDVYWVKCCKEVRHEKDQEGRLVGTKEEQ